MSVSDNERGNDRRHPPVGPRRPPIPAHQGTLVTGASRVRCADRDASAPCRARWRPPATTSCQPDRRARVAIALDPPPTLVAGPTMPATPCPNQHPRSMRGWPVQAHLLIGKRSVAPLRPAGYRPFRGRPAGSRPARAAPTGAYSQLQSDRSRCSARTVRSRIRVSPPARQRGQVGNVSPFGSPVRAKFSQ